MSTNKLILEIRVIDSGIGISKEDQTNLFKPFFRSGDQANRQLNQNGHGIGLSICKKIAERLDGTITVNSKLNVGTIMTFSFSAPYTETFAYNNPFRHPKDVLKMKAEKWKKKRQMQKKKSKKKQKSALDSINESDEDGHLSSLGDSIDDLEDEIFDEKLTDGEQLHSKGVDYAQVSNNKRTSELQ
jgi:hypothetical protein